ncbi:MAG: hypothetical protein ACLF0P_15700 [Thermoanaerobaculia bacterium]
MDETGTLFSPALDVALEVVSGEEGAVTALEGRIEGRAVRLERAEPAR